MAWLIVFEQKKTALFFKLILFELFVIDSVLIWQNLSKIYFFARMLHNFTLLFNICFGWTQYAKVQLHFGRIWISKIRSSCLPKIPVGFNKEKSNHILISVFFIYSQFPKLLFVINFGCIQQERNQLLIFITFYLQSLPNALVYYNFWLDSTREKPTF